MIIEILGQELELLPEKAIYWRNEETLLLADVHFGKVATFQKKGIPLPEGNMEEDFQVIQKLVKKYKAKRLVVLGDLFHSSIGFTPIIIQDIADFLKSIDSEIDLVVGNHDRPILKKIPQDWLLKIHLESFFMPPFCLSHHPLKNVKDYVLCGHIHPVFYLKTGFDQLKLPCFKQTPKYLILPAFSSFAGGINVKREKFDQIYVTTGKEVIKI